MSSGGNTPDVELHDVLGRLLQLVAETVLDARRVAVEKDSFHEFSFYLDKVKPILLELLQKQVQDSPTLRYALVSLQHDLDKATRLMRNCASKGRLYLFLNCRAIVRDVEKLTHDIGDTLRLLPLPALQMSPDIREATSQLYEEMQEAQFKVADLGEAAISNVETGIQEQRLNSKYAHELLMQIAGAMGMNLDTSFLQEVQNFKRELEATEMRKNEIEATHMKKIITLISFSPIYFETRVPYTDGENGATVADSPPMNSFYCPLLHEVMEEPVEVVANGVTFERVASEDWMKSGKFTRPKTKTLSSFELRPNLSLKPSIQDWKKFNTSSRISALKPLLCSSDVNTLDKAVNEVFSLSGESHHDSLVALAGLIPQLVNLLATSRDDVKNKILATLRSLAVTDENKVEIVNAGGILRAVRILASGEKKRSVALLMELSENQKFCDSIAKEQGCIQHLLEVKFSEREDSQAPNDVEHLLDNLAISDQNVITMARHNYYKPLVTRLHGESRESKIALAKSFSQLELTEDGKVCMASEGAINPLVKMLSGEDTECQAAALAALHELATPTENAVQFVEAGAIPPLLNLLVSWNLLVSIFKEQVVAILANVLMVEVSTLKEIRLNLDAIILQIFSIFDTAEHRLQIHFIRILRGLAFWADESQGIKAREKMREVGAIELLLTLCAGHTNLRNHAVHLLNRLGNDLLGGEKVIEKLRSEDVKTLIKIIETTSDSNEKAAALGILSAVPLNSDRFKLMLIHAEALPTIIGLLKSQQRTSKSGGQMALVQSAVSVLLHFTSPSDLPSQKQVAELGGIEALVHLLNTGTPWVKQRAATALEQLSTSSAALSQDPTPTCGILFSWFSNSNSVCSVHGGTCSERTSFCLLKAKAVGPLVAVLKEKDSSTEGADDAALGALMTLLDGGAYESGVREIDQAQGIPAIIDALSSGGNAAKEKAAIIIEKVFRVEKHRNAHSRAAKMPLINVMQSGNANAKRVAATTLSHLGELASQSSFF